LATSAGWRGGLTATSRRDAQLLEAFARRCEEGAFAALVRRHGPMVWGVCRRVLNHLFRDFQVKAGEKRDLGDIHRK
jgi:hypothetical protein